MTEPLVRGIRFAYRNVEAGIAANAEGVRCIEDLNRAVPRIVREALRRPACGYDVGCVSVSDVVEDGVSEPICDR